MTPSPSIGRQLRLLSIVGSGTALLAASLVLLFFQLHEVRSSLLRRLGTVADLIAFNSAAAVDFNDAEAATTILGSLKTRPEIQSAGIAVNGRLFASYYHHGAKVRKGELLLAPAGYRFTDQELTVFRPVSSAGRRLGMLFIQSDLSEIAETWRRFAVVTGVVAIPALLIAILISQLLQRAISRPILNLASLAAAVSSEKDYSQGRELTAANKELESFSYSVSHDLRAPLRAIDGFSKALLSDYSGRTLDERGTHYLGRVRVGTLKMSRLIDDMLHLARVTRSTLERRDIHLTAVAEEVAAELARRNPDRHVLCLVEPGLRASADTHLLSIVFENLLGNAWKFTGNREGAQVEVGKLPEGDEPVFFVRDNGAGFDMTYANKLFGAFQRLHPESDFEGTGIGLATVKRIVTRHGGRHSVRPGSPTPSSSPRTGWKR